MTRPTSRPGRALACGPRTWALVACLFLAAAIVAACLDSTPRPSGSVSSGSGDPVAAVLCDQAPRALAIGRHLEAARDALARLDEPALIAESGEAARIARLIQGELQGLGADAANASPGNSPTDDAIILGLVSVASWGSASGRLFEGGLAPVPPSEREEWRAFFGAGLGALDELGRRYANAGLGACWEVP